ncbi:phenylacetic acid degradation bifunctional protein PaaZ [Paracoccus jeotgali]|uniref:Phenylacetic acid degradation bifunctional protein PaaZ n=1 Tax=Paracoccus jeotgali TaxID=2065379 RepID=A0A2K9MDM0_9RHOB|nr:phenylacetic acid degradation bifunctional protein PaaZ [Paracoccus jeotgali]AUM73720.1 phenylacetic acid degradation bifunctional protein PaaZ [Paracoccus jeotgali]
MNIQTQPRLLQSYVCGQWRTGSRDGKPLLNAATGEVVALIDASGFAHAETLDYGRSKGGPALRALTTHQRALMLKEIGLKLLDMKEDFYAESLWTGATRADGWVDIEGGIGTLLTMASKARRELPNVHVIPDGPVEKLSQDDSFSAQHILSPMEGVAIHINAFNFPVWGMLEKIAPNLIAGMPAIVKPASQTAYLTELMVRRIIDMDILPEGALQLVAGSAGDLLDHVTCQDVVTFTGSAETGRRLRTSPAIIENSVRFTMEADSLNASILGSDAGPGSEEFDLFIREIQREMTSKAGQKCTAIRRAILPAQHVDAAIAALSERLGKTVTGDPADKQTRMGPLASLDQREEVRDRIAELQRSARIVLGDPDEVQVGSGDTKRGAFVNPVVMLAEDPAQAAAHDVEAFGPVVTLMPYESNEQAVSLARQGKGSLVASVFTNSNEVAHDLVLGIASYHGRVMIGNRKSAKSSTGHGSPLAPLIHGGPGRAGGGEELGGMRAVKHYMQRSAIQGPPELLTAVTGIWSDGADAQQGQHPFRKPVSELRLGDQIVTPAREVTQEDVEHFAHFTGDTFYAHMDSEAAKANPFFDDRVAHGYLIASFAAGLFVDPDPGPVLANYGVDNLRFLIPVYFGDTLQVRLTCKEINPRENAEHAEVRWDCRVTNQKDEVVAQYDVLTMVAKEWP